MEVEENREEVEVVYTSDEEEDSELTKLLEKVFGSDSKDKVD